MCEGEGSQVVCFAKGMEWNGRFYSLSCLGKGDWDEFQAGGGGPVVVLRTLRRSIRHRCRPTVRPSDRSSVWSYRRSPLFFARQGRRKRTDNVSGLLLAEMTRVVRPSAPCHAKHGGADIIPLSLSARRQGAEMEGEEILRKRHRNKATVCM